MLITLGIKGLTWLNWIDLTGHCRKESSALKSVGLCDSTWPLGRDGRWVVLREDLTVIDELIWNKFYWEMYFFNRLKTDLLTLKKGLCQVGMGFNKTCCVKNLGWTPPSLQTYEKDIDFYCIQISLTQKVSFRFFVQPLRTSLASHTTKTLFLASFCSYHYN